MLKPWIRARNNPKPVNFLYNVFINSKIGSEKSKNLPFYPAEPISAKGSKLSGSYADCLLFLLERRLFVGPISSFSD